MPDLTGKVAVVTGASRGIGRATAEALVGAGAKVVLASRTQEELDVVADEIRRTGGEALGVAAHTGDPESVEALFAQADAHFGGVDVLVNNAATNPHFGPVLSSTPSQWDKTFGVNVRGYFLCAQAAAPYMVARGGGAVVNVASVAGRRALPGMGVYCVSKAAVLMLTEVLAAELASDNIRVNALVPGFVKTQFSSALWANDEMRERTLQLVPQRRMAEPDEIGRLALLLASPDAAFVTGSTLVADGGQLVGTPGT